MWFFKSCLPEKAQLREYFDMITDFLKCSSDDDEPVIVYVSKMFAVGKEVFPENQPG